MVFSDSISQAYFTIYEGIKDYRDYCSCQRKNTIEAMIRLQMIMLSFSRIDASEVKEVDYDRCKYFATRDFNRALEGDPYCEADDEGKCDC